MSVWYGVVGVVIISAAFSVVGFIAYLLYGPGIKIVVPEFMRLSTATTTEQAVVVPDPLAAFAGTLFTCEAEKALKAEFLDESVTLALSDGRLITLPETVAISGARYANTDESFIFHTEDHNAFVEENTTMTYVNCVTRP